MEVKYLSCAETAKLVRIALKKKFPGVKFSVTSDVYSGGASIDVRWLMGPTVKEVDAVAGQYAGADFDGSIDMETYYQHWLLPDGSAIVKSGPGTEGSMGSIPAVSNPMPEGAMPVRFGAHYVQTSRSFGHPWDVEKTLIEKVAMDMCALQQVEWKGYDMTHELFGQGDRETANHHSFRLLCATSFAPGETYAGVRYMTAEEAMTDFREPMVIIKKLAQ